MAKKRGSIGTAIGGVLVGLDGMIMRTVRPPAEAVEAAKPAKPIAADDGGTLTIDMPEVERPRPADDPPDSRATR
jgi:hypothetical protein